LRWLWSNSGDYLNDPLVSTSVTAASYLQKLPLAEFIIDEAVAVTGKTGQGLSTYRDRTDKSFGISEE